MGIPSGRGVRAAVCLAVALLGLSGCAGFLVVTGPPEENNWEVADHGQPGVK